LAAPVATVLYTLSV